MTAVLKNPTVFTKVGIRFVEYGNKPQNNDLKKDSKQRFINVTYYSKH